MNEIIQEILKCLDEATKVKGTICPPYFASIKEYEEFCRNLPKRLPMKRLFFCRKCGKFSLQEIYTVNRCFYCGAGLTAQ